MLAQASIHSWARRRLSGARNDLLCQAPMAGPLRIGGCWLGASMTKCFNQTESDSRRGDLA